VALGGNAWIVDDGPLSHRSDAVFVTQDRRAAMLALAELGRSRVAHPFDLWLHLQDRDLIRRAEFKELCRRTVTADTGLPGVPWRLLSRSSLP